MKRMLINATQEEELRVAIVDGQKLYDLDIEVDSSQQKKANIYKGKITRIEPSLDAAFVDYGAERHGFLPLKDISREYFVKEPSAGSRINIKEVLKEGQDIVVQIDKDERGNKGAALTTFISLAGRFIVLMPNNPRGGGVSRRISGEDREEIRRAQRELQVPDGMSCIVRTAGIGRSVEELKWDLEYLQGIWQSIMQVVLTKPSPFLIYQDSSPVVRALRDHFNTEIGEIVVDDPTTYEEAREFMEHAMPHNLRKLKAYEEDVPLFTRYQIESQIESAYAHTVNLPSGGSIVIDHTEALVSIDINSARATKGGDIEATALATNLEAADEIARQCRLRDLGGLLVIDFIDMGPNKNQRAVENRLREAVRTDRARVQIGRISRFGLLEMSRQRLRRSLGESAHQVCPRCSGSGSVRSVESLALAILRLVGEEARKERTAKVITELPVDVATFLLNEKRDWIKSIEDRSDTQLLLISNPALETPNYTIRRVRDDQTILAENSGASYTLITPEEGLLDDAIKMTSKSAAEKPAVAGVKPATPAPAPRPAKPESTVNEATGSGLFGFFKTLFGGDGEQPQPETGRGRQPARSRSSGDGRRSRGNRSRQGEHGRKSGSGQDDGRKRSAGNKQSRGQKKSQNRKQQAEQKGGKQAEAAGQQAATEQTQGSEQPKRRRRRRRRSGNRQNGNQNSNQGNNARDNQNSNESNAQDNQNTNQSANPPAAEKPQAVAEQRQPDTKPTESKQPEPVNGSSQDAAAAEPKSAPTDNAAPSPAQNDNPPARRRRQRNEGSADNSGNQAQREPAPVADDAGNRAAAKEPAVAKDNDRLLPWETPQDAGGKPQRAWSSEEDKA